MAFHIGTSQSKIFQNGLDESFLGHVNGAIGFVFNVNSKEVFNVILCGDVQPCGFNFLDDVI